MQRANGSAEGGRRRLGGAAVLLFSLLAVRGAEARAPGASTAGAGLGELEQALESDDPDARRSAVGKLAELDDERAWALVLRALGDRDARVADRAQLVLERAAGDVAAELLGTAGLRAREEGVRRRAAEVIGRLGCAVDGRALARGLTDRSAEVRRRVAWSLERLAGAERLEGDLARHVAPGLARKAKGDRDPLVRAAALLALAAIDGEAAFERALDARDDRREEVRCAAVRVVVSRDGEDGRVDDVLAELARDDSPRVRSLVCAVQERRGTRGAAEALVDLLETEPRTRVRWGVVEALRRLSGMKYRLDPRPWRLWVSKLDADWRPTRVATEPVPEGASRAFAGLPLLSDRVAFLFDFSGSLWSEREDGSTKKEFADVELRRALAALPEDARFNVVPYTDRPFPWSPELVPATRKNVARALEFFDSCRESGQGDFLEAALFALSDPEVDTVVVLTDGAPTGGEVWSLDLMVPLLLELNRFRAVRFDSVLVDAPGGLARHWRDLAEGSGGRSIAIEAR